MFKHLLQSKESFLLMWSTPIYAFFILAEMVYSYVFNKHLYKAKDTFMNVYLSSLNFILDILVRVIGFFILNYFFQYRLFEIENIILYWLILLIAEDFMYYWEHRVDHFVRFFWAFHVTHHSSELFNLTTGFRSTVFQPLYRFIYYIPLALLGFSAVNIMFMYAITQMYGILIHTKTINKLGFLEYFMATPSHHRVHHASNAKYIDKNMGMVFIIWDKLFGTFEREDDVTIIQYGLTKIVEQPYHPVHIITHEWQNMVKDIRGEKKFKNKILYLIKPPGWTPEKLDEVMKIRVAHEEHQCK